MTKPDLFICHTQYHVLASLIKVLARPRPADIILSEAIPGRGELAGRLSASGAFRQVLTYPDEHWPAPPQKGWRALLGHPMQRRALRLAGFSLDPRVYGQICIYNDWTPLGRWLQDWGAHYILGEDTRNHLAHPSNIHIDRQRALPDFERRRQSGKGYLYWGGYRGVDGVEMSDPSQVPYYQEKAIAIDPLHLLEGFGPDKRGVIRRVFVSGELPPIDRPTCLLLPRSFYVDRDLPSQEAQNRLCLDVVAQYAQGYQLFIKTHPRDTTDYKALFPEAVVLDRFMPSELLDYCFEVRFARAVGLCTASVANLKCADEKISLGYDFIEPYR